ncbi:MAG: LamG-like jellyroll fold domain-containing protein, partial [Dehalococcoidia bacterium]
MTVIVVNLPRSGEVAAVDTDPTQLGPQVQPAAGIATPANFKVAFIGDSSHGSGQRQVLDLIRREGADLVLHQGDMSYQSGPTSSWTGNINNILGSNFPYLASDGNHDSWGQYIPFFRDRLSKMGLDPNDLPTGNNGNYTTVYQGLKMVFVREPGDASYIKQQLAGDNHIWKICSWHKNRRATNVGPKGNQVSGGSYVECINAGAMIAQGHSHTYSRSKTVNDFVNLTIDTSCPQDPSTPDPDNCVSPGSSFFFDNSLGGTGTRSLQNTNHAYWANYYSGNWAALFIEFNVDGNPAKARGYLKNTSNQVIDSFVVHAIGAGNLPPQVNAGPDQTDHFPGPVNLFLDGTVSDDGLPETPGAVTTQWTATGPAAVSFADANAVDTTATFTAEGRYTLTLTANDGEAQGSDTMVVNIKPEPVLTSIEVSPLSAAVKPDGTKQFSATGLDQSGDPFPVNPAWSVSGGGSIDQAGLFTAGPAEGGPFTVTATDGNISGTASVIVAVNADMVGYWTFDEPSGSTANDLSGSANHGQLSNGATLGLPGTLGNGVSFPSSGQVQVGTADWDNNHGTLAFWAKANGFASGDQYFFGHTTQPAWANRIQLYTNDASGLLDLGLGNSHARHLGIADLNTNTWHHIALTWEGTSGSGVYHVYVDGQDLASGSYSGLGSLTSFAHVGNDGNGGTHPFNGLMDDARVYNRALSPQEIADLQSPEGNQSPTVDAGPDQSATLNGPVSLALDATVTDDGLPNPPGAVSTLWSASGPAPVAFDNAGAVDTNATFSVAGVYTLTLTADDSEFSPSDSLTVTIQQLVNQPPAVNAGPDQSATLNGPVSLALDATVTDDGLPNPPGAVSTLWAASGPAPVVFDNASAVDTNATFDTLGTYTLTLSADDGDQVASDSMTVTVEQLVNQPPAVNAGPDQSATLNGPVSLALDATVTDDGLPNPPGAVTTLWSAT